jgi:hypothetical protein
MNLLHGIISFFFNVWLPAKFVTVELSVYLPALVKMQFSMTASLTDTITEVSISE